MKKKLLLCLLLLFAATGLSQLLYGSNAKAQEQIMISRLSITQLPSKTIYTAGEELELTDMIVEGYGYDGNPYIITDYTVEGYDKYKIGLQAVMIKYMDQVSAFLITVVPAKVTGIHVLEHTDTYITLAWDKMDGISLYEIHSQDAVTGEYVFAVSTTTNTATLPYSTAAIQNYKIKAIANIMGTEYRGELSDPFTAVAGPGSVTGLTVAMTSSSSVSLLWNPVEEATGYLIYRSTSLTEEFKLVGKTDSLTYTDENLVSGRGYLYKVNAYILDETHSGPFSQTIDVSTNPAKAILKYKVGDGKVRISWSRVSGATSYELYIGNGDNGSILLDTINSDSSLSYTAEGLINDTSYRFYIVTIREYNGVTYNSEASDQTDVVPLVALPTSTAAKYFSEEADFINSMAYKTFEFFRTNVDYSKSLIIPGLINTNVGGFTSTSMVPQGLTIAENYLIISAYDMTTEENTVLYVMDKNTKELLTTLILPSKPHAGGLSYDGVNLWVTTGKRISSIPFTQVEEAAQRKEPYVYVQYNYTKTLGIVASYITYFEGRLWVGSYNEQKSTYMYSFWVDNNGSLPVLTKSDRMLMPNRVQGVSFSEDGSLFISRSCQLYKGLRGYLRQIDVYRPLLSEVVNGTAKKGARLNYVQMPSMNEGIATDGEYLYVNFESAAFTNASYKVDRVTALKIASFTQ